MTEVPDAVLALIELSVPGVSVFDGIVPSEPPDRYAVFYPDNGTLAALAACGDSDDAMFRFQVTSVAPDRQMASWVARQVRDAIVDVKPVADGWICGPTGHTYSQMSQRDEAVQEVPVVFMADLYEVRAQRV